MRFERVRCQRGRAPAVAVLVATLAVGAVGCADSGDDQDDQEDQPTSAEAWASDVCSSALEWRGATEDAQAALSDTGNLSADTISEAVDDLAAATATLISELADLGPPDTDAGDEAAAELSSLADQLQEQEVAISAATESPQGAQDLLSQVSIVTGAIATVLADISTAVDNIRGLDGAQELENAFKDSSTCQELGAGASPSG
jgi:hypothetical protein